MRNRRKPCGCPQHHCGCDVKEIVYPVKENVVHCCSEETIKHVHPSHTTVVNHHLVKNEHIYPHTTSYENTFNEVNVPGNEGQGNQVGGVMNNHPNNSVSGPMNAPSGPKQMGGAMGAHKDHPGHHQCGPNCKICRPKRPRPW